MRTSQVRVGKASGREVSSLSRSPDTRSRASTFPGYLARCSPYFQIVHPDCGKLAAVRWDVSLVLVISVMQGRPRPPQQSEHSLPVGREGRSTDIPGGTCPGAGTLSAQHRPSITEDRGVGRTEMGLKYPRPVCFCRRACGGESPEQARAWGAAAGRRGAALPGGHGSAADPGDEEGKELMNLTDWDNSSEEWTSDSSLEPGGVSAGAFISSLAPGPGS